MNGLALCAGIGGIELGLRLAIPAYRCVGYCERDPYAAAVIVARMEDQTLDRAPIYDSLESFPSQLYRQRVDIVSSGFPCQPFSVAGQRQGSQDERYLWWDILRAIVEVEPGIVFLENSPAIALFREGLPAIFGTLSESGFDAEWGTYSAAAQGAPHLRERIFILAAHPHRPGLEKSQRLPGDAGEEFKATKRGDWWATEPSMGRVADGVGSGAYGDYNPVNEAQCHPQTSSESIPGPGPLREVREEVGKAGETPSRLQEAAIDSGSLSEMPQQGGPKTRTEAQEETETMRDMRTGLYIPAQQEQDVLNEVLEIAGAEECREEMARTFSPPGLRVVRDHLRSQKGKGQDLFAVLREQARLVRSQRLDRLRCLGNGVVPRVAAFAFRDLLRRFR